MKIALPPIPTDGPTRSVADSVVLEALQKMDVSADAQVDVAVPDEYIFDSATVYVHVGTGYMPV